MFSFFNAQNPYVDSLQQVVQETKRPVQERIEAFTSLGWEYRRINLDSGFFYLQQAHLLLPTETYDSLHFDHDYTLGTLKRYNGDYAESIEIFQQCLDYANKSGIIDMQGRANYAIAIAYNENREYEKAIIHIQQAKDIYNALGIVEREVGTLNVLATILKDINRNREAEKAFLEAARLGEENNILYQLEPIYNNLATTYMILKEPDKSLEYYQKALQINQRLNDLHGIATVEGNIANLYFYEGNYEQAYNYFLKSIAGKQQLGAEEDLMGLRGQIGATLIYMGQKQEGLQEMEESLALAKEKEYKNEVISILGALIKSTYDNGMFEVAARYQKEMISLQKENYESLLTSKVNELNARYQKAEQDQEIALLSSENELQKERIHRQRLQLWGGGAILFLVSLLLFSIYLLYRKLSEQNKIIAKALVEKEILLKEIHHRVKNNLQVVSSLLNLQSYKIKDEVALKAIKEGRTRVHSMSLIHQTLYRKDNLTGVNINDYLDRLCQSLFDTYKVSEDQITLQTDISPLMLDVDSVVPLGLIINELITNALKYAFPEGRKGNISIEIKENSDGLLLAVNDDGVGIADLDQMQQQDSFGYELINAFSQKLEADLKVRSQDGTQVSLLIRNYQKAA
jgi:two-component sensor histidine kinase/Tfp pilus assembly protein PilF